MKTITLAEASKTRFSNEYHNQQIIKAEKFIQEFTAWELDCMVRIDGNYLEYVEYFLKNTSVPIRLSYSEYKKEYCFFIDAKFKNIRSDDKAKAEAMFDCPNKIFKPSTKAIQKWVDYLTLVYNELQRRSEENTKAIDDFISSLDGLDVKWFRNEREEGEVVKNGIKFSFTIKNGYISKNIELHYSVYATVDNFKKLSENCYTTSK